jgi:hypothetical protein
MDFGTSKNGGKGGRRQPASRAGDFPNFSIGGTSGRGSVPSRRHGQPRNTGGVAGDFRIPAGARKAALVHLALEAWRKDLLDPKQLGEVTGLQRALYRSSMGEIEHILGPVVKGRKVVVEGHLAGTGRSAIERLGAEVEELRLEDEKRYIDMTPVIFVFAAVAMAVRYISLGLDDQSLYILAGIAFALMYGLRPFFFKMQRPKDE